MLTPVFTVTQDNDFLYFNIKAPYSKVSEAEIIIDDTEFKFYAKPYYLCLELPRALVEDERSSCSYDADQGVYWVKVAKSKPGHHFENLDMLTKLLTKTHKTSAQPLIEVLNSDSETPPSEKLIDFDWSYPSTTPSPTLTSLSDCGYGFANQKSGVFEKLRDEVQGVVMVSDPEKTCHDVRNCLRKESEKEKFDAEHYLADLYDNEDWIEIVTTIPPWCKNETEDTFTDDEKYILKELPRVEHLLDKQEFKDVFLGLVDILFSYAYNWRATSGDYNVESAWNLRTLSSTLSWCCKHSDLQQTIVTCYRRALCYPLFRNWNLAQACHHDVAKILSKGKKYILKCLLDVLSVFQTSDQFHLLNDLYIKDYCVWIQSVSTKSIASLSEAVDKLTVGKSEVELELDLIEEAAKLTLQEEEEADVESSEESTDSDSDDTSSSSEDDNILTKLKNIEIK